MEFGLLTINFQDTPIEIRDRISLSDTKKMDFYTTLSEQCTQEIVILSTCNRCEFYFMIKDDQQIDEIANKIQSMYAFDIHHYMHIKSGKDAMLYLFEVTSGFHSMVIGEDQILGQMVEAVTLSRNMGCMKKTLDKIFKEAIRSAKKLKTKLKISEHPMSLCYIGMQQLKRVCDLKNKRILVLGSGDMARLAITYAYEYSALQIYNCNRSLHHAHRLIECFPNIIIHEFSQRYELLKQCDIVISATSSSHIILHNDHTLPSDKEIFMLDLASPRDIDPTFANVLNIDSLKDIAKEHQSKRYQKIIQGKAILEKDVDELCSWLSVSKMDESLHTMQEFVEEVVLDTYAILDHKLDLNDRERFILKKTLHASMLRLMREPMLHLKQVSEEDQAMYQIMIKQMYQRNKEGDQVCI